jgi:hypothetical protein
VCRCSSRVMLTPMAIAVESPQETARFGESKLSPVACLECYDTGLAGGSQYSAGTRCESCRGPGIVRRALRLIGLEELLAAPTRTLIDRR